MFPGKWGAEGKQEKGEGQRVERGGSKQRAATVGRGGRQKKEVRKGWREKCI